MRRSARLSAEWNDASEGSRSPERLALRQKEKAVPGCEGARGFQPSGTTRLKGAARLKGSRSGRRRRPSPDAKEREAFSRADERTKAQGRKSVELGDRVASVLGVVDGDDARRH